MMLGSFALPATRIPSASSFVVPATAYVNAIP
jgi:hypothetical protein